MLETQPNHNFNSKDYDFSLSVTIESLLLAKVTKFHLQKNRNEIGKIEIFLNKDPEAN